MSMTPSHRAFLHKVVSRHVPTSYPQLLIHEPSLRAIETQMLLPAGCIVQKTITLQLGPLLLQVSGIGDFSLGRRSIRAIASALGLSRREASHHSINPAHCDPEKEYGLQAGMVSPFLPPKYPTRLAAVVQIPWPVDWEREQREVAIALSLCESLMLPLSSFLDVLREYRGFGLGRLLWRAAMRWGQQHQADYQLLQTQVSGASDRLCRSEGLTHLGLVCTMTL